MKYIKHLFLILSLFAVLACGSDGSYTADGDSTWACYSPQSAIYNAEINSNSEGASRSTAAVLTVTFLDNNSTVYEVQVSEGYIITLPDIRAKHCFHGSKNQILLGWNDKNDNYTTGGVYKVTKDVTFTSVWDEGVEIYNAAELDNISKNLSGKYKLMKNIDLKDYMTDLGWTPIGNENERFTGRLYGNGYRIDNLTIDNNTGSAAGLFGEIGGSAEIYDLSINLADSGISLTTPGTDKAVGALAGYIKYDGDSNIIIKNVRTSGGEITADNCSTTNKNLYAGGLVGGVESVSSGAHITLDNLSNSVPVSVESDAACDASLGGIIGRTELTYATASLTSSVNYGEIKLKDKSNSLLTNVTRCAGGLIGRGGNITVKAGANRDNVTVSTEGLVPFAGGIVGRMEKGGTIDNNSNSGYISASSTDYDARSGGIAGYMEGGSSVVNSHNSGDVIATATTSTATTSGEAWSGGIVGVMMGGDIDNDNNTGAVEAISTNKVAYSGGVVGRMFLYDASVTINNSSNTGKVTSTGDNASSGGIAGGLVAYGTVKAQIENNSNTGKVEADASNSFAYSGGIAGVVSPGALSATLTATIYNCSNVGSDNISASVSSTTSAPAPVARSGGIVGSMEGGGSIINSYNSDNVTADISVVTGSTAYSGGIVGYSTGTSIANSYATGDVKATANATSYAGGLVGHSTDTNSIANSYATGDVTATTTPSSSSTYAGGLVGEMFIYSSITNSYATGDVSSTFYAGGLVGNALGGDITNSVAANLRVEITQTSMFMGRIAGNIGIGGTVTNNFAYEDMDPVGSFNSDSDSLGEDKTDGELKTQSTYETDLVWGFGNDDTNPWKMPDGGTGYPILYWQKQ